MGVALLSAPRDIPREIALLLRQEDLIGLAALAGELHAKLAGVLEKRGDQNARQRRVRKRDQTELPLEARAVAPEARAAAPAVPSASAPSAPVPAGAPPTVPSVVHPQPSVPSDAIDPTPPAPPLSRDSADCHVTSRDISPLSPTPPNTSLELPAVATAAREAPVPDAFRWAVELTVAANRGIALSLGLPAEQLARPLLPQSGYASQAVAELRAAGVPLEFAKGRLYELASMRRPEPPRSLSYWVKPLIEAWQQAQARDAAAARPAPSTSPPPARSALRRIPG